MERGREGGDERENETDRQTDIDIDSLFPLFVHSLVDSCLCPDWGSNPQPWCIGRVV